MIDLLGLHTHTTASGHAYNSLYKTVRLASERGIRIFGCSDHAPATPGTYYYYHFINFRVISGTFYDMKLTMSMELNIMNYEGEVDPEQDLLWNLDYAITSLHHPCIKSGTMTQNANAYLGVIRNPAMHIISHPGGNRYPVDYDTLVSTTREHKILSEVSSSSLSPMNFRQDARENYLKMLEPCKYCKTPVIVDNDTHCKADSGDHVSTHALLEGVSFPPELAVSTSLDLLADHVPRFTPILAQPDDAGYGQAGRDAGDTTSVGGTAPVEDIVSTGDTGK